MDKCHISWVNSRHIVHLFLCAHPTSDCVISFLLAAPDHTSPLLAIPPTSPLKVAAVFHHHPKLSWCTLRDSINVSWNDSNRSVILHRIYYPVIVILFIEFLPKKSTKSSTTWGNTITKPLGTHFRSWTNIIHLNSVYREGYQRVTKKRRGDTYEYIKRKIFKNA